MTIELGGGRVGGYDIIGVQKRVAGGANLLVLDTNVVIDMATFYFTGPRGRRVRPDLHALLSQFPDVRVGSKVDIKYGFAVEEASWVRGVGRNRADYRRLMHAASTMIEWTRSEVEKTFANRHPPANRDKAWSSRVSLSAAEELLSIPPHWLLPTYACFLYLCRLDRTRDRWRNKDRSVVMAQYVEWMVDDLGALDVYAVQLGLDFLLGNHERLNGVRALLERAGNEAPDLIVLW